MKATIIVRLKEGVLDPQGQTICRSLNKIGYGQVSSVRQGKYFELELDNLTNEQEAQQLVEQIARDVLSNAIIESFEIEEIS